MGSNQKLKLMYLMKILLEKTDENHGITMPVIISSLESYGITAERKSIYTDIEYLRTYGLDIVSEKQGGNYIYYIGSRDFELAELKLLVDAVQSSKFITAKKSEELIKKIEGLASKYEASQLQRQVFVNNRIKTMNESIYYNVDKIHTAIGNNCKIRFQYYRWNVNKEMELRKNGGFYTVSPWALTWDDENYYMVSYDSENSMIKYFRVDKMIKIELVEEARDGKVLFEQFNMAEYGSRRFGMFDGKETHVKILFENSLIGVVIDRFGKNVKLIRKDEEHFEIDTIIAVSRQFLSWIISLGDGAKIVAPQEVVNEMKNEISRLMKLYE